MQMQNAMSLTSTTIGKKALVAVTGAILFGFVIGHLVGNLQVFIGRQQLNEYSEFLHGMPEALWAVRFVLLLSLIVHVWLTIDLARRNGTARTRGYRIDADVSKQDPLMSYARKSMVLSGPLVLAFVLFHLAHLTLGAPVVPNYSFAHEDVYANVVHGFRNWVVTAFYVIANILLGLHLYHGGQSLLQSLGLRSPKFDHRTRPLAMGLAAFVTAGNIIIPISVLAGLVGRDV